MRIVCLSGQVPNGLGGQVPCGTVGLVHLRAELVPLSGRGTRGLICQGPLPLELVEGC